MRVIAFNGSPNKKGNTYMAINRLSQELESKGIEVEIINVGSETIHGCMACGACGRNSNEKCLIGNDIVNDCIQKIKNADGVILGSPVYYGGISGTMKCFMDRVCFVCSANGGLLSHKVGTSVVALRRSGATTTFDQLNKYLMISEMVVASSSYWNNAHGTDPGEAIQDDEGMNTMKVAGQNMAWILQLIEYGKGVIEEPKIEEKIFTNFIR